MSASRNPDEELLLPIFRDRPELLDRALWPLPLGCMDEAMIDMIVDERALRAGDGILDRLKLLRDIDTGSSLLDHPDDAAEVSIGAIEPLHDRRMAGVRMLMLHAGI